MVSCSAGGSRRAPRATRWSTPARAAASTAGSAGPAMGRRGCRSTSRPTPRSPSSPRRWRREAAPLSRCQRSPTLAGSPCSATSTATWWASSRPEARSAAARAPATGWPWTGSRCWAPTPSGPSGSTATCSAGRPATPGSPATAWSTRNPARGRSAAVSVVAARPATSSGSTSTTTEPSADGPGDRRPDDRLLSQGAVLEGVLGADDAGHRLPPHEAQDVGGGPPGRLVEDPGHQRGVVRRAEQVRQLEERVLHPELAGAEGLHPPGVDPRRELRVRPEVLVQGRLVDDPAARHVDQDGSRLHQAQLPRADQAAGAAAEGQGDHQHVRRGEHSVEVVERPHEIDRLVGPAAGVDRVDAGPERSHQPAGGLADTAEAEDPADRPAYPSTGGGLIPDAGGELGMALRQPLEQRQRHRQGVLGHGFRIGSDVAGDDRLWRQLVEGELVRARGEELHEPGAKGWALVRVELAPPVPHQQRVGGRQRPGPLLLRQLDDRLGPDLVAEQLGQLVPAQPEGDGD